MNNALKYSFGVHLNENERSSNFALALVPLNDSNKCCKDRNLIKNHFWLRKFSRDIFG